MTKKQVMTRLKKLVRERGGDPRNVTVRESECVLWLVRGEPHPRRRCTHFAHPANCPTGLPVHSILLFKPVPANRLGLPGFLEVVAEGADWEAALAKAEERTFW